MSTIFLKFYASLLFEINFVIRTTSKKILNFIAIELSSHLNTSVAVPKVFDSTKSTVAVHEFPVRHFFRTHDLSMSINDDTSNFTMGDDAGLVGSARDGLYDSFQNPFALKSCNLASRSVVEARGRGCSDKFINEVVTGISFVGLCSDVGRAVRWAAVANNLSSIGR